MLSSKTVPGFCFLVIPWFVWLISDAELNIVEYFIYFDVVMNLDIHNNCLNEYVKKIEMWFVVWVLTFNRYMI